MRVDILAGELCELLFAEQLLQSRHVGSERISEPYAVRVGVHRQSGRDRNGGRAVHRCDDRCVAAQHVALQIALQSGERTHAASAVSAIARARSSSASSTGRSGILSSRSIIVATGPKRATAAAY